MTTNSYNEPNERINEILNRESEEDSVSIQEVFQLIRLNLLTIIIITLLSTIVASYIAISKPNIYRSTCLLRISETKGSILENTFDNPFGNMKSNTFIENEIEVMKIFAIRKQVAENLLDTIRVNGNEKFNLLLTQKEVDDSVLTSPMDELDIIDRLLPSVVNIEQKNDLELVNISVESPSKYEATLIANEYAKAYTELNKDFNRVQLKIVKEFLQEQVNQKFTELTDVENKLSKFQQDNGIVELSSQAVSLIDRLSQLETKKNDILLKREIEKKNLSLLKKELKDKEPKLSKYVDNFALEKYLDELLTSIAKQKVKLDILRVGKGVSNESMVLRSEENKLAELLDKKDELVGRFEKGLDVSTKEDLKKLMNTILDSEIRYKSLLASSQEIDKLIQKQNRLFEKLPVQTIEYARLERSRVTLEKLYLLVQEKYQEAIVNEQSVPANVIILDKAREARLPSKPNRRNIVLIGLLLGMIISGGFVFVRNFFDNTVKTPEDIQKLRQNVLAWIPRIEFPTEENRAKYEFITLAKPSSSISEAFRALRTRLQFIRKGTEKVKTVMVTSSSPREGKTVISVNLANTIAQSGKRTIVVDCDLRKPRMHKVFGTDKKPGMTEYFIGEITLDEAIRKSDAENLFYMTCGSIPSNPSEILGSVEMEKLLDELKEKFDFVVLDSPPIIAVTDSEILSTLADASILVVKSEQTEKESVKRAVELLKHDYTNFAGIVLNDFVIKKGYYSYYKYYYYYSATDNKLVKDDK